MQDLKQQSPVAVLLNIDYRIVLTDVVNNVPRKTSHVLQEPGID